ncbi:hypothetical protein GCM10010412_008070 [Nonomuraea recticatena]|uniref:Uncharacterized protein n=1 Tax=Nonomuraea recticatena TaxID=46178 RepID=A0ABN3R7Q6_9ACTN
MGFSAFTGFRAGAPGIDWEPDGDLPGRGTAGALRLEKQIDWMDPICRLRRVSWPWTWGAGEPRQSRSLRPAEGEQAGSRAASCRRRSVSWVAITGRSRSVMEPSSTGAPTPEVRAQRGRREREGEFRPQRTART